MNTTELLPRIAVTLGDPAGVGPELAVRLLARPETTRMAEVYILADAAEVEAAAQAAGVVVPLSAAPRPGYAVLLDDASAPAEAIPVQQVSQAAGERTLHQLKRAVALANAGEVEAILFTPLNKTSLKLGGMNEEDELRWFARELDYEGTTSELNVLPGLWTARVTSHIPVSEIAERITVGNVLNTIRLLHSVLVDSGLESPRIAVCALNPHAGENGNFGREEIDQIAPGIAAAREDGMDASGPFPSDTVFLAAKRGDFDGVVTMYHDQGQIAMKLIGFDRGVTIQGGLPIVIATPAHGTAFDIVGKNAANLGATEHAFELAVKVGSRIRAAKAAV
ncbi:4-hydroxythreonine-4-phosphate dehydrogenase PdxA [Arthrobacter sp. Sa2BUA2]|uniref:4-hydroxythreonine-4-phosphate dehydrogenase PdxA n=1 Tax=Arthrobacter pullicola TaxID=2762224 RepID=A0ABR8YEQ3_9MICC|nr:4-hydroxythreonine-4-phosphate dehydrogenase PdxA [Arthrobacter pullicola]MBD8042695.1 4-hydroxythreonine-4-phosphate dehydrogenase PdxA [Arthrobacter pullicola]